MAFTSGVGNITNEAEVVGPKGFELYTDDEGQALVYATPHRQYNAINLWAPEYILLGNATRPIIFDQHQQHYYHFAPAHDNGRLEAITDRHDNRIDLRYNTEGRLCHIQHSNGFTLRVNCTLDNQLRTLSVGDDTWVRYDYAQNKHLIGVYSQQQGQLQV